jgi:hypothetical protein
MQDLALVYIKSNQFIIQYPLYLYDSKGQYLQFELFAGNMDKLEDTNPFLMDYSQIYIHLDVFKHCQSSLDMHMPFSFSIVHV